MPKGTPGPADRLFPDRLGGAARIDRVSVVTVERAVGVSTITRRVADPGASLVTELKATGILGALARRPETAPPRCGRRLAVQNS